MIYGPRGQIKSIHSQEILGLCGIRLDQYRSLHHFKIFSYKRDSSIQKTILYKYYYSVSFFKPFVNAEVVKCVNAGEHPTKIAIVQFLLANEATRSKV